MTATEMRSLGSEIRFNCIRDSRQIKLAEVLQNSQPIAGLTVQPVNIFIEYLSRIHSELKLNGKKKRFVFPLLSSSSGGLVILRSSLMADWIRELISCGSKVIHRKKELGLVQGNSLSDFPVHLRSVVTCSD